MSYVSINFVILVAAALIVYYIVSVKYRWYILLLTSLVFYVLAGKAAIVAILASSSLTYFLGLLIGKKRSNSYAEESPSKSSRLILIISYLLILLPWIGIRLLGIPVFRNLFSKEIAILGISFYTLELVSYITDIYKGEFEAEKNYLHFITYAIFFPKVMQGPICRYSELAPKLFKAHSFDEKIFTYGFLEVLWGAFLKYVIADKCRLIVDPVFDNFIVYDGLNLWLALALFLIVLYTDFLACVMICKGVSYMFGIDLFMNFKRPLLATSFREFWQRWHISLSNWLAKYIYIPLGGSRKGEARRLINLLITFGVSALWHGINTGFLMWGLLQAVFRMTEEVTSRLFRRKKADAPSKSGLSIWLGRLKVCFFYGFSLVFFNLPTAKEGFSYIKYMFNFTGLINVKGIGLIQNAMGYKEFAILLGAILLLLIKGLMNEANFCFKEKIINLPFAVRLAFYVICILFIINFGTYGNGFNSADFIYGGF